MLEPEPNDATPFLPGRGGLAALRKAAAECHGCHLWRHATQTVFGEGRSGARVMLVGEQPGDREDREGRPFVGPAGRELDRALEEVGIDRGDAYVTNVVKHFKFEERGKRRLHKTPKRYEIETWGPSTDPRDKRLAVEVEDHALEYASFEGRLPEGTYGAGAVIVWDTGPYRNLNERDGREVSMAAALDGGHASFWLEGHKLAGGWSLSRFRAGAKPQWLLVKRRDEHADARRRPTSTQPESVISGRTIETVAAEPG